MPTAAASTLTTAIAPSGVLTASAAPFAVLSTADAAGTAVEFFPVQLENLAELTDEVGGQLA